MTAPTVSQADLQRVHAALRITVPLDQASPMLLATLTVVAHCWLKKEERERLQQEAVREIKQRPLPDLPLPIDLKRRAAGDFDE